MATPLPSNEKARLKALRRYDILDTAPEPAYDDLTWLAAHICGTPCAYISLLDETRQWFKSKTGILDDQSPRETAICSYAILQTEVLVIEDTWKNPQFASNPLVTGGPKIRFYAGTPLITHDGYALGVLCVTDRLPRSLDEEKIQALKLLGRQVVRLIETRQATTQLQTNHQELQVLFDLMPAMICLKDTENRILRVNQRLADAFGLSATDLEGKHTAEVYPEGADKFYANDLEVIQSGLPKLGLVETLHTRGGEISVQTDRVPVINQKGKVTHVVVKIEDISERRKSEESLRLLSSALEQSQESIMITDGNLNLPGPQIVYTNPAFTRMTGYTAADLIGKTPRILQGPQTERTVLDRLRLNLEQGTDFEGEAIQYRKDGSQYFQEWRIGPIHDRDGKTTHFVAAQHDITERKKIEARLRRLVDSNAQGVILWNRQGQVTEANDAYLHLIGYTRADLEAGRINWVTLTPPEFAHLDQLALEQMAATGTSALYEKEYIHKNGSRVPILLGAATFEDNPNEGVCFFVDLTQRKQIETQLVKSQKMETVGKLAGGIAHEFNSILTAIIGQSELLLRDLPSGSHLSGRAAEISQAANRAATLTSQLLAYSRKQMLRPEILDLNQLLSSMSDMLSHIVGHGIDIRMVTTEELPSIRVDAGQMEQVIMNIVMNAQDAMPDGGKLTLETARVAVDPEPGIQYPEMNPGEYVLLAISDTGSGMSKETAARIFEPFFTTKETGEGTGLGLSTCYGIVKQSGGHLNVYSELGLGTTFKIHFPAVDAPSPTRPSVPIEPLGLPHGVETILLVEDDPALREMAATLLKRLGYTVLSASNGVEALGMLTQCRLGQIDLLFTDLVMPQMNGKELADRMFSLSPHTRFLFTSAYTDRSILHQGVLNEGVAILQKPFSPSALARKVREVLDSSN